MLKRIIIIPYKMGSNSAKNLQQWLQSNTNRRVLRVRKDSTKFIHKPSDFILAWGNCSSSVWVDAAQEGAKAIACNKLRTFEYLKANNIPHPEWTTSAQVAKEWDKDYVARTVLSGHSGEGIVMCSASSDPPPAPLYVQYKKKKNEYRVHVFNNKVIDVTQKKRVAGFEGINSQIRNHQNGWVYCREDIIEPSNLREIAITACSVIGLAFGAVDIIWNQHENMCYVLEVNTAPGLEGTSVEKYGQAFKELIND